ncbi:MAG: response regulator [Actinobacteria bacterium]|nr:response regulator [Actinomycetota bacterium]
MFEGEVTDRTRSLEDGLLALPELTTEERDERLDALARDAHTLKGSSALMEAPAMVRICHTLEDEFADLRGAGTIERDVLTRLLGHIDDVRTAAAEFIDGPPPPPDGTPTTATVASPTIAAPAARTPAAAPSTEPRPGAAPSSPASRAPAPDPSSGGVATVRLPSQKLDRLVTGAAELRAATTSLLAVADQDRRLQPLLRGIDRAVAGIDGAVRDAVTVPVREACEGLARAVRDIADSSGKEVRFRLDAGDAEIDRRAIGVVRDALVHLVRNAADHGIEPPQVRAERGKPPVGTVAVSAGVRGDRVAVTVRDDGRGVDVAAVEAAAQRAGLTVGDGAHELVFAAGVSTAAVASEISGRGVGLDAVRDRVESLGGAVSLRSDPGEGTEVTLVVPASLATARVLLVEAAGEQVALLTASVQRLVRVGADDVVVSEGRAWLCRSDDLVPLVELAEVAGLAGSAPAARDDRLGRPAVTVATSTGAVTAMLLDRVIGEQELMIQPVGPALAGLPALVGAGVLPSGRVVLLLHPAALVRNAQQAASAAPIAGDRSRGRVLLAEDAPTTLALEQGLLEAAGFDVLPAEDGRRAWDLLRDTEVDIVVSDIEMPHVDGIELCRRIRGSAALQELPVILVTSRGSDEDRRRGAEAGADAYLVKSSFAQGDLVAAIERALA